MLTFVHWVLLIAASFFGTVFVTTPAIQSIWNMLVFPSYPVELESGIVLFVLCVASILKVSLATDKNGEDKDGIFTAYTQLTKFYITLAVVWGFAKLYTFFI